MSLNKKAKEFLQDFREEMRQEALAERELIRKERQELKEYIQTRGFSRWIIKQILLALLVMGIFVCLAIILYLLWLISPL